MEKNNISQVEAQASKKVKGAKASKTPCIDEVAQEVYKSDHKMVWYDLLKESKRLTNLIDFNEYCHSLQRNPAFVAQHVAFEGSGVVNKVMRYGVESVLGDRILAYDEPLYNPVKIRGLLDEAKPTAPKTVTEPTSARVETPAALVESSIMEEQLETVTIVSEVPTIETRAETVGETTA